MAPDFMNRDVSVEELLEQYAETEVERQDREEGMGGGSEGFPVDPDYGLRSDHDKEDGKLKYPPRRLLPLSRMVVQESELSEAMMITKAIAKKLPMLYAGETKKPEEIQVPLKIMSTWGANLRIYITEFDGQDVMFGYVDNRSTGEGELGYFSLGELSVKKRGFPLFERDKWWNEKTTLKQVMDASRAGSPL